MKNGIASLVILLMLACSTKPTKEQLPLLNGYWEIKEVTFPNGQQKKYAISTTVDYFELKGTEGYKKKMNPKLNGTYDTSDDAEFFKVEEKEGRFFLHYKNALSDWEEELLELDKDSYRIKNQEGITYFYERYEAINITP